MPKRDLLHEWMHRYKKSGGRVLRIWTQATPYHQPVEFREQRKIIERTMAETDDMHALTNLSFVNAVEELDRSGDGRLVYVDWP